MPPGGRAGLQGSWGGKDALRQQPAGEKDEVCDPLRSREDETMVDLWFLFIHVWDRELHVAVRGIFSKHSAAPVPELTTLPGFRDKGPARHLTGPLCLASLLSLELPHFSLFSNHTSLSMSSLLVTLPPATGPSHVLPLCLKCTCQPFFT